MNKDKTRKLDELYWEVAAELHRLAIEACADGDPARVHWLVTEERRMGNMPRVIKLRFGDIN